MSVLVIAFLCRFISSETTLKCWARFHRLISENSKTSEILEPSHFRLHNKWRVNFCFNHLSNPFFSCLQFPQRFSCYHHYCWEEENSLEFARRQMESNPHFLIFIQVNILVAINTHTHTVADGASSTKLTTEPLLYTVLTTGVFPVMSPLYTCQLEWEVIF